MHLVLVGLNNDAGQGSAGNDALRRAQIAVPGREAPPEERNGVYLAAGLGEHVEVFIMDVDVAGNLGLGDIRRKHFMVAEILGTLGTVLEHGAHGRVAVDIGVLTLDVSVPRGSKGKGLVDIHEGAGDTAAARVVSPVNDVGLGCGREAELDERGLHEVLHVLNGHGLLAGVEAFDHLGCDKINVNVRHLLLAGRNVVGGSEDGGTDLYIVEGNELAVPLADGLRSHVPLRCLRFVREIGRIGLFVKGGASAFKLISHDFLKSVLIWYADFLLFF